MALRKCVGLLIVMIAPVVAHAFDFKGVELNAPATPALIQEKLETKCGAGSDHTEICNGYTTVAGAPAEMNLVIGKSGNVRRIHLRFSSPMFETAALGLIEKFGKPTSSDTDTLQNRMGATFQQVTHVWRDAAGNTVTLRRYASNTDKSTLSFASAEDHQEREEQSKQRARDL